MTLMNRMMRRCPLLVVDDVCLDGLILMSIILFRVLCVFI